MRRTLVDIKLYRLTHIENIPHILQNGITHKNSKNANLDYKNIGDISLIKTREQKQVDVTNGKDTIIKRITLGDFVPFYFGVKMPMLFVIQNGGNFTTKTLPSDIIYIVCLLDEIIQLNNIEYYFTDGHAIDNLTTLYDSDSIQQINYILDFQAINAQFWGGEENLDTKRKKQAEFLIKGDLPVSVIDHFICYDFEAMQKMINFGIRKELIFQDKNAYY